MSNEEGKQGQRMLEDQEIKPRISLLRGDEKIETDKFLPGDLLTLEIANVGEWKSTVVLMKDALQENRYKARRRGKIVVFGTKLQKTKRFGKWTFHIEAPLPNGEIAYLEKGFHVVEKLPKEKAVVETAIQEKGELLTEVPGIGPTYFKRLKNENIVFFADLLHSDPEKVKEITKASIGKVRDWFLFVSNSLGVDYSFTEKQKEEGKTPTLTNLTGIGAKTAEKLNGLGISSISDLANAPLEKLLNSFGRTKSIKFINSARDFMGMERLEIKGIDKIEKPMSSLTMVKGIGPTYQKRLEDQGIGSIEDLIKKSPEQLANVLKCSLKKAVQILDYASSLSQGKFQKEDQPLDRLTKVPGIGPTYAKRLIEKGITTYEEILKADEVLLKDITKASLKKIKEWKDYLRR